MNFYLVITKYAYLQFGFICTDVHQLYDYKSMSPCTEIWITREDLVQLRELYTPQKYF